MNFLNFSPRLSVIDYVILTILPFMIAYGLYASVEASQHTNLSLAYNETGEIILLAFARILSFGNAICITLAGLAFRQSLKNSLDIITRVLFVAAAIALILLWYTKIWPIQFIGYMGSFAKQEQLLSENDQAIKMQKQRQLLAMKTQQVQLKALDASIDANLAKKDVCNSRGSKFKTMKENCFDETKNNLTHLTASINQISQTKPAAITLDETKTGNNAMFESLLHIKNMDDIETALVKDFSKNSVGETKAKYYIANAFTMELFTGIMLFVFVNTFLKTTSFSDSPTPSPTDKTAPEKDASLNDELRAVTNDIKTAFKSEQPAPKYSAGFSQEQASPHAFSCANIQASTAANFAPSNLAAEKAENGQFRGTSDLIENAENTDMSSVKDNSAMGGMGFLAELKNSAPTVRDSAETRAGADIPLREDAERPRETVTRVNLQKPVKTEPRIIREREIVKIQPAAGFKICELEGCTEQFEAKANQRFCCTQHKDKQRYLNKKAGKASHV